MHHHQKIGAHLSQARRACGLSIEDVANRMAVTAKTVKNWESGKSVPRANRLHILSGILGVPLAWFYGESEYQPELPEPRSRIDQLEEKVQRIQALQNQLLELSNGLARDVAEIREIDDELEEFAA